MVSFHDFNVERLAAYSTLAALPLIDLAARVGIKSTNTQMMNVAIQDIGKDTGFLLYVGVRHQFGHLFADSCRGEFGVAMLVI